MQLAHGRHHGPRHEKAAKRACQVSSWRGFEPNADNPQGPARTATPNQAETILDQANAKHSGLEPKWLRIPRNISILKSNKSIIFASRGIVGVLCCSIDMFLEIQNQTYT